MEELGMDKTFQVAIGVSVVLFFITLNILFKDSFPSGVRNVWSRVTGTPAQVTVTTDTPVPPPVEEPKRKPKLRAHARIADPPEPLPEKKPPTEVVKVELPPPPFPTAQDLRAGMSRREMIGRFGAPRFTASWSESGSLAEKFIYIREAQVTAVILRDGEVVISRTGHNDPWERSAWWQTSAREKSAGADRDGTKMH
jgi:hypothetical protein